MSLSKIDTYLGELDLKYVVPRLQDKIPVSAGWHACFVALSESFDGHPV